MKAIPFSNTFLIFLFIIVGLLLTGCQFTNVFGASDKILVSGEILVSSTMPAGSEDNTEKGDDSELPTIEVVLTRELSRDEGTTTEILAQGEFEGGKFSARGRKSLGISEASLATLTVTIGENESLTQEFWMHFDNPVEFILFDYSGQGYELALKGHHRSSRDPSKKFTLSGDLSNQEVLNPDTTIVQIQATVYAADGTQRLVELGNVMVEDGRFAIESDIENPTVTEVTLRDGNSFNISPFIAEAGILYELKFLENIGEFGVKALAEGAHSQLVDAWLWNEEILDLIVQSYAARDAYMAEMQQAHSEPPETSVAESTLEQPDSEENLTNEFAIQHPAAAECQHVDLNEVVWNPMFAANNDDLPDFAKQLDKAMQIAIEIVSDAINESEDPWVVFAGLQLDAFPPSEEWTKTMLQAYRRISSQFSDEFVEQNINPVIARHMNQKLVEENDAKLVPGQMSPTFTLVNLEGEEVSLTTVLQTNERVLVDFWASWCGPCIASFPKLKEMYAAYQEEGFAIVGIAIDDTEEDWRLKSEELELPWINLGENRGFDGPTPIDFGVQFIPKTYLLDSEGCIVQKDLETSTLETVLSARYGNVEVPAETESN